MFEAFRGDERAIEGLPIRLVIALVVGVASLSVMMNMISGLQGLAVVELDARPSPEVTTTGEQTIEVVVVDPDGARIADATVLVRSGSAAIEGVEVAKTGPDGVATMTVSPTLRPNQDRGTLVIDIKPPAGSEFVDRRANTKVLVIRG
jgi:hypothetical protein